MRWKIYVGGVPLSSGELGRVRQVLSGPETCGEIEVMPVPDEAAVDRVAEALSDCFGDESYTRTKPLPWRTKARVILAALEDQ